MPWLVTIAQVKWNNALVCWAESCSWKDRLFIGKQWDTFVTLQKGWRKYINCGFYTASIIQTTVCISTLNQRLHILGMQQILCHSLRFRCNDSSGKQTTAKHYVCRGPHEFLILTASYGVFPENPVHLTKSPKNCVFRAY